jgi:hypothetical protein
MNCNYFIPNAIGRQALWLIGKIRMRLADNGAPVAVKRVAVVTANNVKILPVFLRSWSIILQTTFNKIIRILFKLHGTYYTIFNGRELSSYRDETCERI